MNEKYLVAYTIFSSIFKYGFKTYYKHFSSLDNSKNFVATHPNIKDNYVIYKNIEHIEEVEK